jgi:hypothetical protein
MDGMGFAIMVASQVKKQEDVNQVNISPPNLDTITKESHTQKNNDSVIYGTFFRIAESANHIRLDIRYITHGVMAVDAATGLSIIIVPIMNPAVLTHWIVVHRGDIVKLHSSQ